MSEFQKHLYMVLYPNEALIASELSPAEFGMHYAVGSPRHFIGKTVFAEIDIDFILDERLRELNFEEKRRLTLARLGLVYERTIQYNPFVTMESYHNLYPIPFSEIERNTEAELEQNSGYTN